MKYFSIKELCDSNTARQRGIKNDPTPEIERNLTALVDKVLDPLREAWGGPITVNSGYRCPALNKAVGGSSTSDHLRGFASDITVGSRAENKKLFQKILDLKLPFKQLIDERSYSWVHVSYDPNNLRRQILKL